MAWQTQLLREQPLQLMPGEVIIIKAAERPPAWARRAAGTPEPSLSSH